MADNNQGLDKDTLEKVNKLLGKSGDNLNDFEKAVKESADATDKAKKRLEELGNYVKNLGSTSLSTEQGMSKYGKSITAATDAVGDAVGEFGLLGKAVGFLIKQIGGMAAASLKQQDALMKSYRTLSDFGAIDSSGLKGVLDNMLAMGANTEQMENFHRTLKDMGPDLVALGGTAAAGAKQFAQVSKSLLGGKLEDQLKQMGYTTEEIVKYGGQYVAMQARSNSLNTKNTGEMAAKSADYMKTLTELTMYTGQQRDAAQKVFEDQQRDIAFRVKMREMQEAGQGEEAERMAKMIATVSLKNKDLGDLMREQFANDGGMVTARLAQLGGQFPEMYSQLQAASRGTGNATAEAMQVLKNQTPEMTRMFKQFGAVAKISAGAAGDLGYNVDMMNSEHNLTATNIEEVNKEVERMMKGGDARIQSQTELEKAERRTRQGFELFLAEVGDRAVPVVESLAKAMNKLGAVIADVVYWITSKMPGMDVVDFRSAFKEFSDLTEVAKTLREEGEKQEALNKEIKKNDEDLLELKKKQEVLEIKAQSEKMDLSTDEIAQGVKTKSQYEAEQIAKQRQELEARNKSAKGELRNSQMMSSQASAQSVNMTGGASVGMGKNDLAGLALKQGDVQKEGAVIDPKLIALAKKIQAEIPGFAYFSSFNDNFHQDKKSNHNKGLALDFVLSQPIKGDTEAGKKITNMLKSMGASTVIDEYNNPTTNATGGHIHAEVSAKTQGLFKGPESGYWLKAHGEEALLNQQGLSNLITKSQVAGFGGADGSMFEEMNSNLFALGEKMDEVVKALKDSHGTQQQILNYSKV